MKRYIIVLHDIETYEIVTTTVIEAENDLEACIKASEEADKQNYALGDIVPRD